MSEIAVILNQKEVKNTRSGRISIENVTAIEQGIINSFTKRHLDELESKHRDIETEIIKEKMKRPQLTAEQVLFWFERMREYDITVLEQRKRLVDTFVNAIFVYNDRIIFTFNYRKDAKTVLFSDLKSSDITNVTRPNKNYYFDTVCIETVVLIFLLKALVKSTLFHFPA